MTEQYPDDEIERLLSGIVYERPYPREPQSEPELSWSYDVPAGVAPARNEAQKTAA